MTSWPAYAEVRFADYGEEFDPSVQVTEMERGVAKQTILNSQVMQSLYMSVQFRSAADVQAFEDWYFNEVKRVGWFEMEHPRVVGKMVTARFQGGKIGRLTPLKTQFQFAKRDLVVEYQR